MAILASRFNDNSKITTAINELKECFHSLNMEQLPISEYTKNYLNEYLENYDFLMVQYRQLLVKAMARLSKPIDQSTFIDYGGGCGILSFLARKMGFDRVVYLDIYDVSVGDAQVIANRLDIDIDDYILGDVEALLKHIKLHSLKPDLICSFDVLEHIYDLEYWIENVMKIDHRFNLIFMTAANSKNPLINHKLKKLHRVVEFKGLQRHKGWKEIDLSLSFYEERKKIIKKKFDELQADEIDKLAKATRGLRKDDILKVVGDYIRKNKIEYQIEHPTNTCDPYTGNWAERLIDIDRLKVFVRAQGLNIRISNSFYGYSKNRIYNLPKYILNLLIGFLGEESLVFSPTFTLEIQNNR